MAVGSAFAPDKIAWGRMIANQGVAVALVDPRNSLLPSALFGRGGSNEGPNEVAQFPGGSMIVTVGCSLCTAMRSGLVSTL